MDPLIKSQLLYQLSYTPVAGPPACTGGGEGADHTQNACERKAAGRSHGRFLRMTESDPPETVDFTQLEKVAAGDEALVLEVLGLFCGQAPVWIADLDPSGSEAAFRAAAHSLKGSALAIGAGALASACAAAEQAAGAGPAARAGAAARVRAALESTMAQIEDYRRARAED